MGEIKKKIKLANFRDREWRLHRGKSEPKWKPRPGMSDRHLERIRKLPCTRCGSTPPSDPHHLKSKLSHERGMGQKATDRWTVPLCRDCHEEVERKGTAGELGWFQSFGIDPHLLAQALWNVTGDQDRMLRVLLAHQES